MNFNSRITIAISRFFRKHGTLILVIFVVWLALFLINQHLKRQPREIASTNTYTPDRAIMDENGNVPTKYRDEIKSVIQRYFDYCKSHDYTSAYNLLTTDCKEFLYNNNIAIFQDYISSIVDETKTYYIQNYSNADDVYIYDLHILDDIEITGGTGGYSEHKEKIAIKKENSEFKISNQGYIGKKSVEVSEEDENMKIRVVSKDISYQKEAYNLSITNKTDKFILISDGTYTDSVTLNLGDQKRNATNTASTTFLITPNTTKNLSFVFDKFADDEKKPTELNLNDVRIYDTYNTSLSAQDASKLYSINISLKK